MSAPAAPVKPAGWSTPRLAAVAAVASIGGGSFVLSALLTRFGGSGLQQAQENIVLWVNDLPRLLGAVLAAVNPVLRPVPLTVGALVLVGWVLLTATDRASRFEVVRAGAIGFVAAELITHAVKAAMAQPRPAAVIADLDTHGYPVDPRGYAYPSAHTAVATALLVAMWPAMSRVQRVVGVVVVVLVAMNRIYVGAHWPLDVVGGAGIGLLCAAGAWRVASRWPLSTPAFEQVAG